MQYLLDAHVLCQMADDYDIAVALIPTHPNPDLTRKKYAENGILVKAHVGGSGRRLSEQGYLEYIPMPSDAGIPHLASSHYKITEKGKKFIEQNYLRYKGTECDFCNSPIGHYYERVISELAQFGTLVIK